MGIWGGTGSGDSGPTGYDYVQTDQPQNPQEGETWYDVGDDSAYVYDGASWVEMTVTDHAQLANVTASQHHSRPTGTQTNGYYTKTGNANGGSGENHGTIDITPTRPFADRWHVYEVSFSLEGDWSLGGYETLYFDEVEVLEQGSWRTLDTNIDSWRNEDTGGYISLGSWSYSFDHSIFPTVRLHFSKSSGDTISYRTSSASMTGAAGMPHSHSI